MTGVTRFAPTPSGFLHVGNLVNFQLTTSIASELGLQMALRIDDLDRLRVRPAYVDDIFRCLEWLGAAWSTGPRDATAALDNPQWARVDYWWSQLEVMVAHGLPVFLCRCSRTTMVDGRCIAGCTGSLDEFEWGQQTTSVRVLVGNTDVTLWNRHDDGMAYHLVNVVSDRDLGVTHVVRGVDLAPSTQMHRWLSQFLPGSRDIHTAHHELMTDVHGAKLSKSQGTTQLNLSEHLRAEVVSTATRLLPDVLRQLVD